VRLDDGVTAAAEVSGVRHDPAEGSTTFRLTIREGRKRQIRRSLRALGHPVRALVRLRMGPLSLGRLASGAAREATAAERRALERLRDGREAEHGSPEGSRAGSSGRKAGGRKKKRRPARRGPGGRVSR
jgi:23S rRNA pseudouridine2605 synthase